MDNKSKDFYNIMGRFFGSRIVENKTNDRIYDDNNKEWYIYLDNNSPVAFVSISSDVIKNIYSINNDFLIELLTFLAYFSHFLLYFQWFLINFVLNLQFLIFLNKNHLKRN